MSNPPSENGRSIQKMPGWVAGVLVFQVLLLLVSLGVGGSIPAAAAQGRRAPEQEERVLPNAADQRQEQIRLLRAIADELKAANAKLDTMNRNAEEARRPVE